MQRTTHLLCVPAQQPYAWAQSARTQFVHMYKAHSMKSACTTGQQYSRCQVIQQSGATYESKWTATHSGHTWLLFAWHLSAGCVCTSCDCCPELTAGSCSIREACLLGTIRVLKQGEGDAAAQVLPTTQETACCRPCWSVPKAVAAARDTKWFFLCCRLCLFTRSWVRTTRELGRQSVC